MSQPVIVFGAGGGIGGSIAGSLARAGHPVILSGRRAQSLAAVADTIDGSVTEPCDCTDPAAVAALFERLAALPDGLGGVVFSVATAFRNRLAHRIPWGDFAEQVDGQLKALHLVASHAYPLLANRGRSTRFIVVGTEMTLGAPPIKTAPYAAAKAAMTTYAMCIAQEWLKAGVRVHIIAPGMIRTGLVADLPDAYLDSVAERMPEGQLTSLEDVARVADFCMTDAADPLYGTPIRVSRGAR